MTRAIAILLVLGGVAHADRGTVVSIGITGDGRATGPSFALAADSGTAMLAGARLVLAFEDAPLAIPPPTLFAHDFRLVPELLAGFLADDVHAEGFVGAGARGEIHLANGTRRMRTAIYAAARGIVIGSHQDGAAEFVIGEYLSVGRGATRFGWEGGAMVRPRSHADPDHSHELDAVMTIYVAWSL